jgi:hypothetical protein
MKPEASFYPVRVRGDLDPALSRWQWLVKWILAIPHYIVLFFLQIAYAVVTVIAFFAILFTWPVPTRAVRLQCRCPALALARVVLRGVRAGYRQVPAV